MVKRYKVDTRDGSVGIVEMFPGVNYGAIHSREYVHADDYDALEAEWMALSQDDGKVERALESAQARIRELEADLESVRAINKALAEVLADERANNRQWLAANAPGGWIDDLRKGSPLSDATADREGEL